MNEVTLSYYLSFFAFVQVAVALDFGFMYMERKSSAMRLSDMFYDGFVNLVKLFTSHAGDVLKRVRKETDSEEILDGYDELQRTKTCVIGKTDAILQLGFLKPMGVVAGIYALLILYIVCMFGKDTYYENLFLVLSEITLAFMTFVFVYIGCFKKSSHVLRYVFAYIALLAVGACFVNKGWIFEYVTDFESWYNHFLLLPYLPVVLFVVYMIVMYTYRIPKVIKMIHQTRKLGKLLEMKKKYKTNCKQRE